MSTLAVLRTASARPLVIDDPEQRALLDAALEPVRAVLLDIAERFGVGDPGAADPGELLHELEDACLADRGAA